MTIPVLRLRALVQYPSNIVGGTGIDVTKEHGTVTVDMQWDEFGAISSIPTSPTSFILTFDTATGVYVLVPSHLLGGAVAGIADAPVDGLLYGRQSAAWVVIPSAGGSGVVEQHVTTTGGTGAATINADTSIVRVDQTVGAPITLNMGLASAKTTPVMIVDWKGDAATNNITIHLTGTDKFPGGLTDWVIAGNNGSVFLRPIASVGYVL